MKKKRFSDGTFIYEVGTDGCYERVGRANARNTGISSSDARKRMIERDSSDDPDARISTKNKYQRELDRRRAAGELFPE